MHYKSFPSNTVKEMFKCLNEVCAAWFVKRNAGLMTHLYLNWSICSH